MDTGDGERLDGSKLVQVVLSAHWLSLLLALGLST